MINLTRINLSFSGNLHALKSNNSIETAFAGKKKNQDIFESREVSKTRNASDEDPYRQDFSLDNFKKTIDHLKTKDYSVNLGKTNNQVLSHYARGGMQNYMRVLSKGDKLEAMDYILKSIDLNDIEEMGDEKINWGRIEYLNICSSFADHLQYFKPEDKNDAIKAIAGHVNAIEPDPENGEDVIRVNGIYEGIARSINDKPPADKLKAVETIAENIIITDNNWYSSGVKEWLQRFVDKKLEGKQQAKANKILKETFKDTI